jgi:hypothetical protein
MRSVAMRPGRSVLSVTPSRAHSFEHLKADDQAGAVDVGQLQRGDRLEHRARRDRDDATPAALAHLRQQPLEDRHRREHQRPVRRLPLLAREAERVGVRRRAAGVGDVDVDRAERGLDAL